MEHDFWHKRWEENRTGFHLPHINERLTAFYSQLNLKADDAVFLPLCGKTNDINYFTEHNCQVIGNEISELAVKAFFEENNLEFAIDTKNNFNIYRADNISLYAGDFFKLTKDSLKSIDAVYDRAALVAMPDSMRENYAKHLISIVPKKVKILLVTLEYEQQLKQGPPFSVVEDEVIKLFQSDFKISLLATHDTEKKQRSPSSEGLKMLEKTYLLERE